MSEPKTIPLGVITYTTSLSLDDADAESLGSNIRIELSEDAKGMLATLTDFELRVFAAEVAVVARAAFEMPPSPEPKP